MKIRRPSFSRRKRKKNNLVKLSVNLPEESVEYLRALACVLDITMTEAFRRALGLQTFIHKELSEGNIVYFKHQDGSCYRLIRP